MAGFDLALSCIRDGSHVFLQPDVLDQRAEQMGHKFRNTPLTPGVTLDLFSRQVASGNVACSAVRHLAGWKFSDSAWCQARKPLPIQLVREHHQMLIDHSRQAGGLRDQDDGNGRWRGHSVYVVDGTSDSMPDTPELLAHYGVPSGCREGLGFPTSHLLLTMHYQSGLMTECTDSPMNTSDLSQMPSMHARLSPGDLLLGDVAYSGYGYLALVLQAKLHAVVPMHQRRIARSCVHTPAQVQARTADRQTKYVRGQTPGQEGPARRILQARHQARVDG